MQSPEFLERVSATISRYKMLEQHGGVLIAVSGGADSIALLYSLAALRGQWHLNLHVAHLDHTLRSESAAEADSVRKTAEKLGLESTVSAADVESHARDNGLSLEEAARNVRHHFLIQCARSIGAGKIALGHTLNDQAETVLMRLIRGAGLLGLGGIPPSRSAAPGIDFIRPLLEVDRDAIVRFLNEQKIEWHEDTSNKDPRFFRNRIRHQLLELLEKEYNTNIRNVLAGTAESLRDDYAFIEHMGARRFRSMRRVASDGSLSVVMKKLRQCPPALQKHIIRCAIESVKGDLRRITYQHWKEIEELFLRRPTNSEVHLPQGISVVKTKDTLVFKLP